MDYYQILGVSKTTSLTDIKSAYRKQALRWHPDRNKSAEATDKFKQINKAYEVLSDPKKKEMYDRYGPAPSAGNSRQDPFTYTYGNSGGENPFEGADFGGFSDPFEIFEQFFGFRSPFAGQQRRQRRNVYETHLTFDEAVKGVEKEFRIEGKNKKIKIPAGVDKGSHIRFSDFDLVINVTSHPFFKREGQDVYVEKQLDIPTAVLGGVVTVPTLDGSINLKVRPGTKAGTTVRLREQGIVYPNTSRRGDEYVIYNIAVPEKISSKAKKLLEELQNEL